MKTIANSFYIVEDTYDDTDKIRVICQECSDSHFFYELSQGIAFSDCTGCYVTFICYKGRQIKYAGWLPECEFKYYDVETNEVVWDAYYDCFDH